MHINGSAVSVLNWFSFHNEAADVFFCLSSFTLCLVYGAGTGRTLNVKAFAVARFARVYPPYAIVLVGWTVYSALAAPSLFRGYTTGGLLKDGVLQVPMKNGWPEIGSGAPWIDPMWSLSVEAFGYVAVFPVLFWLSGWARGLAAWALAAGVLAFGLVEPPATGFLMRWVGWPRSGA